jgi:hypothetical protein
VKEPCTFISLLGLEVYLPMDRPLEKPPGSPARDTGPPGPSVPTFEEPSASAEVYVYKIPLGDELGGTSVTAGARWSRTNMPRLLGPIAAGMRVKVPPGESGRLLRMIERITLGATWAAGVTGTFFGAAAAHLPPAGTVAVLLLEITVPPVVFRSRRRKDDE